MDYDSYKTEISDTCVSLFKEGIEKYYKFIENGEYEKYISIVPAREEYTVNSRYLHRGYYCPSPFLDILIDNTRKGKLRAGPAKRKKISNRYLYDSEDKLFLVESYVPNRFDLSREFIWSENNKRYGLLFYESGELFGISIEIFDYGKLQNYMILYCRKDFSSAEVLQAMKPKGELFSFKGVSMSYAYYETYVYRDDSVVQWDLSHVMNHAGYKISQLVFHDRYVPTYENGEVVDFKHVRYEDA